MPLMTRRSSRAQRNALAKFIRKARGWLERDIADTLAKTYGIHTEEPEKRSATGARRIEGPVQPNSLLEILEFFESDTADGPEGESAVRRLIRETAFTHFNQTIALQIAVSTEMFSAGDGVVLSECPPETLGRLADELRPDLPELFDVHHNPLLELKLSDSLHRKLLTNVGSLPDELWDSPDVLGKTYQLFNTDEERRSSVPATSRDLAIHNQYYTPDYLVQFFIHNGLGTTLAGKHCDLRTKLSMLCSPRSGPADIDLADVTVLDPACGSGNLLLEAYDVLERAWGYEGVCPRRAAPKIIESLWGVDIDPRATQLARAALILRARRHCVDKLPIPNVICARPLPSGPEADALMADLPPPLEAVVRAISQELDRVQILGPLLRVERCLRDELWKAFRTGLAREVPDGLSQQEHEPSLGDVLDRLDKIARSEDAKVGERLFKAASLDAVRFVKAMNQSYTAVVIHPPFSGGTPEVDAYLRKEYPWIPTNDYTMAAAFVSRGLELTQARSGTCSAVTPRADVLLKTLDKWRRRDRRDTNLDVMIDLAPGVLEQSPSGAAGFVLSSGTPEGSAGFRLRKIEDRETARRDLLRRVSNLYDPGFASRTAISELRVTQSDRSAVPGSPLVQDYVRKLIEEGENQRVEFKQTALTSCDETPRKNDPRVKYAIAKAVCGFLNTGGGTLLIGVHDDGYIVGLTADSKSMGRPKWTPDGYQLKIREILQNLLSHPVTSLVEISFSEGESTWSSGVCIVSVHRSDRPVFAPEKAATKSNKPPPDAFYARDGNRTRTLKGEDMIAHMTRWWRLFN